MAERDTPVIDDGRRLLVTCDECDSADRLSIEVDPLDDLLFVACGECEQDIAAAKLINARVGLETVVPDLDQLDPRLRPPDGPIDD